MHELSIVESIFDIIIEIAEKNKITKISKVNLNVGKLRQVVPEFMVFAFDTVAKDTLAEKAELIINLINIEMECQACSHKFIVDEHVYICPECDSTKLSSITGNEMIITSIEGE